MSVTKNFREMLKAGQVDDIIKWYQQTYINKYYDAYCSQLSFPDMNYQARTWLYAHFWDEGRVWVRKNDVTGEPVFCMFTDGQKNHYNFPVVVSLTNNYDAPSSEIPLTPQRVDKDGVIVWLRPNHKGLYADVSYYVSKIAEAEAAITINLMLQKMPWLIATDGSNSAKIKDLVNKIFSNEIAVFTDIDRNDLDAFQLNAPYIIDKLTAYEEMMENKLKTLIGLDNQGGFLNSQQQNIDTTNSNNDEINKSGRAMFETVKEGFDRANKVLGLNLRVESNFMKAEQDGRSVGLGDSHNSKKKDEEEAEKNE